jgi:hypothetical protein
MPPHTSGAGLGSRTARAGPTVEPGVTVTVALAGSFETWTTSRVPLMFLKAQTSMSTGPLTSFGR